MLDFSTDQAEGLRRLMHGPKKRLISILAADTAADSSSFIFDVASALHQQGANILLVLARDNDLHSPHPCQATEHASLLEFMKNGVDPETIRFACHQGFACVRLFPGQYGDMPSGITESAKLNDYFSKAISRHDLVLVGAELSSKNCLPLALMNQGEIVVELNQEHESIKQAYSSIKRLSSSLGARSFGILIRDSHEHIAHEIFSRIEQVSLSFLQTPLQFLGYTPSYGTLGNSIAKSNINIGSDVPNTSSDVIKKLLVNMRTPNHQYSISVK